MARSDMNHLDLVIFDIAGTTIRDEGQVAEAFNSAMAHHGFSVTEDELAAVRGTSKKEAIGRLVARDFPAADRETITENIYDSFRKRLIEAYQTKKPTFVPGAVDVFEWLHNHNLKIAFTTGFERMITDLIFNSAGWKPLKGTAIICGEDVLAGRPAPYLIFHAMEASSVANVARVANMGDTINDLQSGANARVRWNIGVCSGAHGRAKLEQAPHTHILDNIASLPSVFE